MLWSVQPQTQLLLITSDDFQQIEAECATAAGMANVERRVDAAQKKMFDALQCSAVESAV